MSSKAFGSKQPLVPHIGGATTKEVGDLRADVEEAMLSLESKSGYPTINKVTGGAAVSVGTPAAHAIAGGSFMQGQAAATLTLGTGTASLAFTANRPGTPGNAIEIKIVQGGGALAVTVLGTVVTITLAAAGSTANAVKAAYDAVAAAKALAQVVSGGAGTVLVAAQTPLAGGTGLGLSVLLGGIEQTITDVVTETDIAMLTTGSFGANGDAASLLVTSNGRQSNGFTVDVVT